MFELRVEGHFDAAHFLRGYEGKCEALHGHRYKVAAKLESGRLNKIGLAYDFTALKKHLEEILSRFDHTCLNDVSPFDRLNPSSENIAITIYKELRLALKRARIKVTAIEVWESPDSSATYIPD